MYYERRGAPRLLIVSDLPMRGADRAFTGQMTQAVKFVLKYRYRFRAGRFTVGYQACDDTSARGVWDGARCRANAETYAAAERVVGVLGPLDSGCARLQLPVLAAGGPLAAVSPGATAVELDRAPGFARVVPSDADQGAAGALLARRLGFGRVALVRGDDDYSRDVASGFSEAAARVGIRLVPRAEAQAVFVAARLSSGGVGLLRAQPAGTQLLLPDGFLPIGDLVEQAGGVAEGAYVTTGLLRLDQLGEDGKLFARAFRRRIGSEPGPYSVYSAQAAHVMLEAIAQSDGSRASVTSHVRTEVGGSPVRIAAYRIRDGKPEFTAVLSRKRP